MKVGILCQHRSGHSAYEHHLSVVHNLKRIQEFDVNSGSLEEYMLNLPKNDCIFSMMPVDGVADVMQAHREIQWIVLLRKDLVKQCLSFLYTNKTGDTARTQTEKVSVDTSLVDYFFELHRVIQEVVSRNVFQVVYYEDLDLSHAAYKATGNDYESLITNLDSVKRAIKKHISLN